MPHFKIDNQCQWCRKGSFSASSLIFWWNIKSKCILTRIGYTVVKGMINFHEWSRFKETIWNRAKQVSKKWTGSTLKFTVETPFKERFWDTKSHFLMLNDSSTVCLIGVSFSLVQWVFVERDEHLFKQSMARLLKKVNGPGMGISIIGPDL